ncbi:MAG: hypothetical protein QNI87_05260 [Erythrobacter sp.]|uniref:hypothetical protein n=1 Tax=Erythrobacter sp. TaxID=1042 RepID=UPI0026341027|nr:hypothetical protein [Erythrobacter sp.]MDJ0977926.1 hypothetical protein [Erythrobacter sp.]
MGEARRRKEKQSDWPNSDRFDGDVELHILAPDPSINGARINELTGDEIFSPDARVVLRAYRAVADEREFCVGFCVGDGEGFTPIGLAVIERLSNAKLNAPLHIVPIRHEDIAWDIVIHHLRTFTDEVLLFAFADSDVYDAGIGPVHYSKWIKQFDHEGNFLGRLTQAQRNEIRGQKAAVLDRPPPPKFYPTTGVDHEDAPWIFRIGTPAGKFLRTAFWNGRRNYAHELPPEALNWVGGDRIAVVQVDSPVGVNRRSSLELTHWLAAEFDGVIHWARDTETFESILRSFIRLDLEADSPPDLPDDYSPEVVILAAIPDQPSE